MCLWTTITWKNYMLLSTLVKLHYSVSYGSSMYKYCSQFTCISRALILKFDTATWLFLKFDNQHDIISDKLMTSQFLKVKVDKKTVQVLEFDKATWLFLKHDYQHDLSEKWQNVKVTDRHRTNRQTHTPPPPRTPISVQGIVMNACHGVLLNNDLKFILQGGRHTWQQRSMKQRII